MLEEEEGQGSIEYIFIVGGAVIAAIVIFVVYQSMTKSGGASINQSTNESVAKMTTRIQEATNTI
ncbi:MAG: hypothetical protein AABX40_08745 [Candidatus Hydrothermarchaeota archaeon]